MKTFFNKLLIFLFILLVYSPYFGSLLGISSALDNTERRNLASFPKFQLNNISNWSQQTTDYFNDNFGFRNIFLFVYEFVKLNIFNTKFIYREIVNKGWSMYAGPGTKDYYDHIFFSDEELKKIKNKLEQERDYLAQNNIPYFIVIAPRKESIYYEYYPFPPEEAYFLQADQLVSYLQKNSSLDILDLRTAVIKAKNDGLPVFYKTDTHWNNYGAFAGYQTIMDRLASYRSDVKVFNKSDFDINLEKYSIWQGDNFLKTALFRKETDQGVKLTLKNSVLSKKPKLNTVLALGDSFMHIVRGIPKYAILGFSPQMSKYIPVFFKNPDILEDGLLIPKMNIEELIPLIYKTIHDKPLADKLVNYLKTSGIKSDNMEGLGYFLKLSFNNVIFEDKNIPINNDLIERTNPDLVIRETIQNGLNTFLFKDY